MFAWRRRGTIIGEGLRVVGRVTAEGLVKGHGQINGELQCASLILSRKAQLNGTITAGKVVIDGKVEGPIEAADVVLKSRAHVVGDIHHQSLTIKRGAYFEGRSVQAHGANGRQPDKAGKKQSRRAAPGGGFSGRTSCLVGLYGKACSFGFSRALRGKTPYLRCHPATHGAGWS